VVCGLHTESLLAQVVVSSGRDVGLPLGSILLATVHGREGSTKDQIMAKKVRQVQDGDISVEDRAASVVESLRKLGNPKIKAGLERFAIPSANAFGISIPTLQKFSRELKVKHDPRQDEALAKLLWQAGFHETRIVAIYLYPPELVTPSLMNAWVRDFDNWGICDTACFCLFDRLPDRSIAIAAINRWAASKEEFIKRAAFALIASIALHDKQAPDSVFESTFPLIERASDDDRNFVKKGVSWALRAIGHRSPEFRQRASTLAEALIERPEPPAKWIGRDVLRDLRRPLKKKTALPEKASKKPAKPKKAASKKYQFVRAQEQSIAITQR
jgi:3-methyladenine DNA glycosylase AlkD